MSELRKLETMTPDEFGKMMEDIGKESHFNGVDVITAAIVMVDPPIKVGFYGWCNESVVKSWEFKRLVKSVKVCDWLDYYGFDRPKWRPASSELESAKI